MKIWIRMGWECSRPEWRWEWECGSGWWRWLAIASEENDVMIIEICSELALLDWNTDIARRTEGEKRWGYTEINMGMTIHRASDDDEVEEDMMRNTDVKEDILIILLSGVAWLSCSGVGQMVGDWSILPNRPSIPSRDGWFLYLGCIFPVSDLSTYFE